MGKVTTGLIGFGVGVALAAPTTKMIVERRERAEAAIDGALGDGSQTNTNTETLPLNPSETVITVGNTAVAAVTPPPNPYEGTGVLCSGPRVQFDVNADDLLGQGHSVLKGIQDSLGGTARSAFPGPVAESFARKVANDNGFTEQQLPNVNNWPLGRFGILSNCVYNGQVVIP